MNKIRRDFQRQLIETEDARNELRPILGEELSKAAVINLAYRGMAGSLICIMAITSLDFEIFTCCKGGISDAAYDFNWFWRQLRKIENLSDLVLADIRPAVKTPTFIDIVRDPIFSGLSTAAIWALIMEVTKSSGIAILSVGIVLLFDSVVLYYWRKKKR